MENLGRNGDYKNFRNDDKKAFGFAHFVVTLACVILVAVATFFVTVNIYIPRAVVATDSAAYRAGRMNDIIEKLNQFYYQEFDEKELTNDALAGLVAGLEDPYTTYMTKEQYDKYSESTLGEYSGIGIVVGQEKDSGGVLVVSPIENTPGERAGLKSGDIIVKIDDYDATTGSLDEAIDRMKGRAGTNVTLMVFKKDSQEFQELTITRDHIVTTTVRSHMIGSDVGYMKISQFTLTTADEFKEQLAKLESEGSTSLVLDLRGNPGGIVDIAVQIADELLPKGVVVYTLDKSGKRQDYNSGEEMNEIPLIVLVDEGSASSSEILGGALKDYGRAKLVGKTTFGKGLVQQMVRLSSGDYLKVTVSSFYTPGGANINKEGIIPDIEIENPVSDKPYSELSEEEDMQLQKALEVLRSGE